MVIISWRALSVSFPSACPPISISRGTPQSRNRASVAKRDKNPDFALRELKNCDHNSFTFNRIKNSVSPFSTFSTVPFGCASLLVMPLVMMELTGVPLAQRQSERTQSLGSPRSQAANVALIGIHGGRRSGENCYASNRFEDKYGAEEKKKGCLLTERSQ